MCKIMVDLPVRKKYTIGRDLYIILFPKVVFGILHSIISTGMNAINFVEI